MAKKQKPQSITGFTFDLMGEEWKVVLKESPYEDEDLGHVSGCCDGDKKIIYLEIHPDKEFLRRVFFHEVGHAAMSCFSTHNLNGKEGWVPEEAAGEAIAQAMLQLVRQIHILPAWVFNRGNV